jgi:hypothetical protein
MAHAQRRFRPRTVAVQAFKKYVKYRNILVWHYLTMGTRWDSFPLCWQVY